MSTPDGPGEKSSEHVDQPAADQAKVADALPAAPQDETMPAAILDQRTAPEVINVRHGSFGVSDGGDTTGYNRLVRTVRLPDSTPRPYGPPAPDGTPREGAYDEIADELAAALHDVNVPFDRAIEKVVVYRGDITFHVAREHLLAVARLLRDEPALRFELCLGVMGAHFPNDKGREFHSVAPLMSITHNRRIRLEVSAPAEDPHMPSLYSVYPAVDWHERESYDMFGIQYDGHPSLTRILMPDDWIGHPQRKDYPLGGIPVEFKGAQIPAPDERRSYN